MLRQNVGVEEIATRPRQLPIERALDSYESVGDETLDVVGAERFARAHDGGGSTGSPARFQAWKPPMRSVALRRPNCCNDTAARLDA